MKEINRGYKNLELITNVKRYSQLGTSFFRREDNDYMAIDIKGRSSNPLFRRKNSEMEDFY